MPSLHLPSALALAFLVTALLAPRGALAASFRVETNALRIKEPASYAGSYDSAIGDFGVPLYGGTLQGRIGHLAANPKGCSNFTGSLPEGVEILLAIRGDCFFVEKAYHAQLAGAKAVIVADNIQEHLLTMAIPEDRPDIAALVPKIAIPVALVQKVGGPGRWMGDVQNEGVHASPVVLMQKRRLSRELATCGPALPCPCVPLSIMHREGPMPLHTRGRTAH